MGLACVWHVVNKHQTGQKQAKNKLAGVVTVDAARITKSPLGDSDRMSDRTLAYEAHAPWHALSRTSSRHYIY